LKISIDAMMYKHTQLVINTIVVMLIIIMVIHCLINSIDKVIRKITLPTSIPLTSLSN
jgi:hypothetical protein